MIEHYRRCVHSNRSSASTIGLVITLRRATEDDAATLTRIFIVARTQCWDFFEITYPFDILKEVLGQQTPHVWLAEVGGRAAGFATIEGNELDRLFVYPEFHGKGVALALLEKAKELSPTELWLWVFQKNLQAIRFYEKNGFESVYLTDGNENMEKEPDARYVWRG